MSFMVHTGDALGVLRSMSDASVNCCVTSPPYWGLRDYGVSSLAWGGDPDHEHEWGEKIIVNATNHVDKRRRNHTRNGRDEEQPIEKRVGWKREDVAQGQFCECGAWFGALGLEPTPALFVEHIVDVCRSIRRVLLDDGTLWLNLGDSYAAKPSGDPIWSGWNTGGKKDLSDGTWVPRSTVVGGLKPKDLIGIPWRVALALQSDGWWLRSDIIWAKPNPMPESVKDRPTRSHEYVFLLAKSERYYYDGPAIYEPFVNGEYFHGGYDKPGILQRTAARNGRLPDSYNGSTFTNGKGERQEATGRNKRTVWTISTCPTPDAHFATYPVDLAEICILAGCPAGGTVLDPFSGAGTTGLACLKHGRKYVGIELNPEYVALSYSRARRIFPLLVPFDWTAHDGVRRQAEDLLMEEALTQGEQG